MSQSSTIVEDGLLACFVALWFVISRYSATKREHCTKLATADINPERRFPSMFEAVHRTAPDIAAQGICNPIGQIWCGAMMLDHLGHGDAAQGGGTSHRGALVERTN